MVIAFAVSDMAQAGGDGKAVCKLLHLSTSTRRMVSAVFQPIEIFECEPKAIPPQAHKLRVSKDLSTFMWEAVSDLLCDWSVAPRPADVPDLKNPLDAITTTTDLHATHVVFSLRLETDAFKTQHGEIIPRQVKKHAT